jgi:hypothetical protein
MLTTPLAANISKPHLKQTEMIRKENYSYKTCSPAGHQWLTAIILATQEAEIRRIKVRSQPRKKVPETPSRKTLQKNRADKVAQGEGPEFKPQFHQKKNPHKTKQTCSPGQVPDTARFQAQ